MAKRISKDVPLSEITLRRYEKPINLSGRELVRKLCLSLGLLQPGDSRDVVVDVLCVMLEARKELGCEEVVERVIRLRKENNLELLGIASSNIRRQLRRLKELFLVEKIANTYRIHELSSVKEVFRENVEGFLLPSILKRINEYINRVDADFSKLQSNEEQPELKATE